MQINKRNLPKKCIIFTQNLQTQEHIAKVLKDNTDYKVATYNGSSENEILRRFGFDETEILISTDKGNESLNWQFACFIINYDFPQVLLNMEQRISRCHRIGQKNDTMVINFICPEIFADVRNYELFYKRQNTYEKILGASDSIISGASDNSIEQNLAEAMQDFRNKRKVAEDFKVIDEEFADTIEERKIETNDILFTTFKTSLVEKTKNMAEYIKQQIKLLRNDINDLTRYVLKESFVDEKTLVYETKHYEITDDKCLKLKSSPFAHVSYKLSQTPLEHNTIILKDDKNKGRKGIICVDNLYISGNLYFDNQYLFLGLDNNNKLLQENDLDEIMALPIIDVVDTNPLDIIEQFNKRQEIVIEELKGQLIEKDIKASSVPIERLTMQSEKKKEALAKEITLLEREIKNLKSHTNANTFVEDFELNQKISTLNKELMKKKETEFTSKLAINSQLKEEIQKIKEKISLNITKHNRFVVYFEVR